MKFDCQKSIKKIINFNYSEFDQSSALNIAWGVDKNFMFGAAISMTSVLNNNKNKDINLHLFTDYIDDDYQKRTEILAKNYSVNISIYLIDADELKTLPSSHAWSYAMYFRFVAFEYLSDKISTVLYIDADVICKGSIADLSDINIDNYMAAVIKDIDECPARSSGENDEYFNSGVMYANLKKWKENDCIHSAINILMDEKQDLLFPDQDVLNILFFKKVIFLPRIYNAIYGIKQELKRTSVSQYKEYITDETILIHYVGVTKPWNTWAGYPSAQYFVNAWKVSPWSDQPLLAARTPKQYKKKSRHERLQGKYFTSIISYIGYLNAKLKSK